MDFAKYNGIKELRHEGRDAFGYWFDQPAFTPEFRGETETLLADVAAAHRKLAGVFLEDPDLDATPASYMISQHPEIGRVWCGSQEQLDVMLANPDVHADAHRHDFRVEKEFGPIDGCPECYCVQYRCACGEGRITDFTYIPQANDS
jgi:hypothetical protein